ncbi:MAG: biotin synthase BioB [Candidatus Omnitrophica bacterium]|nr:biotin synthase BioB [Candidatus Omnitrophota bacterium]
MNAEFYTNLTNKSLSGEILSINECEQILSSPKMLLLPLLQAAYEIRFKHWKNDVTIHIINNVQNGSCSEDCHYCAQSKLSKAQIEKYPMKSDEEILKEAEQAYEAGAFRYCMVFSGKCQSEDRITHLVKIIQNIKSKFPIEVCVSPGFVTEKDAKILKAAGLNRLNHNINSSSEHYKNICTTHSFEKRIDTLTAAQNAGLDICSGVIIGMGESTGDLINAALTLRKFKNVKSIPINFLLPIEGNVLTKANELTPQLCLRILCLYRFLNPTAEIRIAAGREYHLRDLQAFGLYPANSIFMDGYLNAKGLIRKKTLQMIKDAGFSIKSDKNLDQLIENEEKNVCKSYTAYDSVIIKEYQDLHPGVVKMNMEGQNDD